MKLTVAGNALFVHSYKFKSSTLLDKYAPVTILFSPALYYYYFL